MVQCQFETVAEHNCWTRLEKSTHFITTFQGQATNVLHGVPKGVTYEETIDAQEDRFGDWHLATSLSQSAKNNPEYQNILARICHSH
jgi:hypothetical protein